MKKKYIKSLILVLVLSLWTVVSGFAQTTTLEAEATYGTLLKELGFVLGDLREDELITKEEMVAYLAQVPLNLSTHRSHIPEKSPYKDVAIDRWSYKSIAAYTTHGAVKADKNGLFNPTRFVTYAEAAQLIMRNLGEKVTLQDAVYRAETESGVFCDAAKGQEHLTRGHYFELLAKMFNGDRFVGDYVLYNLFLFPKDKLIEFEEKLFNLRKKNDVTDSAWSSDASFSLMTIYDVDFNSHEGVNEAANKKMAIIKKSMNQAKSFDLNAYHKYDRIDFTKVLKRDFIAAYDRWEDYSKEYHFIWESNRPGKYFKIYKPGLERDEYFVEPAIYRGAYKIEDLKFSDKFIKDVYIVEYEVLDISTYRKTERRQLILIGEPYERLDLSVLLLKDRSLVCGAPTYKHLDAMPWVYPERDASGIMNNYVKYFEDLDAGMTDLIMANAVDASTFSDFTQDKAFEYNGESGKIYYNRVGPGTIYKDYDWSIDLGQDLLEIQVNRQKASTKDKETLSKVIETLPLDADAMASVKKFIKTKDEAGTIEGSVTYWSTAGSPVYFIKVSRDGYDLKPSALNIPYKKVYQDGYQAE